jgi:hypothetical protein
MQLQTHIDIKPFEQKINHSQPILSIGSCFADNIAQRLQYSKFQTVASPTGILFNPESIARTIERFAQANISKETLPTKNQLRFSNGVWFSYDFHSSFSHTDTDTAVNQMRTAVKVGADALSRAEVVIITFGTAFAYRLNESGEVVANCHKQPQSIFTRQMLNADYIVRIYTELLQGALSDKRVIFTLSPVRHLGDGLEHNSLSKATLRVAIAEIVNRNKNAEYFPSYEIMMDELRDYRFYADDMAHPSKLAVDYIWERFSECAFSGDTLELIKRIAQITSATEHRPFNPQSDAYRNFCQQMLQRIATLELSHPTLDFTTEKEHFKRYL